ncbi:MAG: twin-arginine translocation signal domain-containing protein [Burkholderiales bacterium]|nr:twin-arginine translocation signal domain-containing protein [Burkholderiales bacterium]
MSKSPTSSRRKFLLGTGAAASAAGIAVVAMRNPGAPAQPGAKAKAVPGRGYQLTEHVRNYYRTTAV